MRGMQAWVGAAVLVLGANGCAPFVVQQGARTVKPGQMQTGMAASIVSVSSEDEELDERSRETYVGMMPNGWARFGLAESVDAGVQFYGGGARVDAKFAPIQSEAFAVALAGGVAGFYQRSDDTEDDVSSVSSLWLGDASAFVTVGAGASMDVNVVARYLMGESYNHSKEEFDGETFEDKSSSQTTAFGGALSVAFKGEKWTLSPEIAVYQVQTKETEAPDLDPYESLVIVPSVGFSVGF